eukprot:354470-Chlamydomonas_euryale.AAC.21
MANAAALLVLTRTVVACIEASVIRAWVRDHELPRLLDHPDVWNLVLVEQCRADQKVNSRCEALCAVSHLVAHEFWAVAEQVRKHAPYERLEACTVFRGDPIPSSIRSRDSGSTISGCSCTESGSARQMGMTAHWMRCFGQRH